MIGYFLCWMFGTCAGLILGTWLDKKDDEMLRKYFAMGDKDEPRGTP